MSEQNVEIVRRGYAMFSAGDIDGVAAMFADDAEIPDAGGLGVTGSAEGTRVGPEGFIRNVAETQAAFDDYRVKTDEPMAIGDAVVVPVRILGRGRRAVLGSRCARPTSGCSRDGGRRARRGLPDRRGGAPGRPPADPRLTRRRGRARGPGLGVRKPRRKGRHGAGLKARRPRRMELPRSNRPRHGPAAPHEADRDRGASPWRPTRKILATSSGAPRQERRPPADGRRCGAWTADPPAAHRMGG